MPTVQQIYEDTRRSLTFSERFQLATLLLNDIPPRSFVDYSTEWSNEDLDDFRLAGERHINLALDAEEENA